MLNHKKRVDRGGKDSKETGATSAADGSLPQNAPSPRTDKKRLHTVRHGVLSKYPLEALARRGENVRQLRKIERMLRIELKPAGILGEIFFDRAWSSYLRCALIANVEEQATAPPSDLAGVGDGRLRMRIDLQPTLVYEQDDAQDGLSPDLMRYLAVVQRYDCHFSREFYRAIGILLALRNAGETGLKHELEKTFGQKKYFSENPDVCT